MYSTYRLYTSIDTTYTEIHGARSLVDSVLPVPGSDPLDETTGASRSAHRGSAEDIYIQLPKKIEK